MAGGVFVTVRIDDRRIQADLEYLKVGQGQYYTFFRPYHLWFLEAPLSVARAHLYRQTTLVPLDRPAAEVLTVAKRALGPGERLDDFGGFTYYGCIDGAETAEALNALPVGLAPGAVVLRGLPAGKVVTWDDVRLDEASTVVRLRRQQDGLLRCENTLFDSTRILVYSGLLIQPPADQTNKYRCSFRKTVPFRSITSWRKCFWRKFDGKSSNQALTAIRAGVERDLSDQPHDGPPGPGLSHSRRQLGGAAGFGDVRG